MPIVPQHEPKLPPGYALRRRPQTHPEADELPTLEDRERRVLARIEAWRPDWGTS